MVSSAIAVFALLAVVVLVNEPIGAGKPEDTKAVAYGECNQHKDYLESQDPCVCFATDIMTTFANDATKTHTHTQNAPDRRLDLVAARTCMRTPPPTLALPSSVLVGGGTASLSQTPACGSSDLPRHSLIDDGSVDASEPDMKGHHQ